MAIKPVNSEVDSEALDDTVERFVELKSGDSDNDFESLIDSIDLTDTEKEDIKFAFAEIDDMEFFKTYLTEFLSYRL